LDLEKAGYPILSKIKILKKLTVEVIKVDGVSHMIVGAIAGDIFGKNSASKLIIGIVTHFFGDMIPHYDPDPRESEGIPYVIVGLALGYFHLKKEKKDHLGLAFGALGGILPDLEHLLYHTGIIKKKYFPTHIFDEKGEPEHPEGPGRIQIPKKIGAPLTWIFYGFGIAYFLLRRVKKKGKNKITIIKVDKIRSKQVKRLRKFLKWW